MTTSVSLSLKEFSSGKTKKVRKDPIILALTVLVVIALTTIIGIPASKILMYGTNSRGLEALKNTLGVNFAAFRNSIVLAFLTGALGTFIGFITAYAQVRLDFWGKRFLHWIVLLPVISPPFAVSIAIITMFGKRGIISHRLLGLNVDIYGLQGLVIVLAMTFAPVAYMNIKGMLENLDPSLDEAAESLGASHIRILFRVTLPMIIPALLSSFLILFVEGLADLANPLVLGGSYQVLATQIYFAVAGSGNIAGASGIAIALLVPALLVFLIQRYWLGKKSVVTVTGKPAGKAKPIQSKLVKFLILTPTLLWVVLELLLYVTIFIGGFTKIIGIDNTPTLAHYDFIWGLGSSAIKTTLIMALIAAPFSAALSVSIGWIVVRHFKKFGTMLDFLGMLGTAIPGTVLGLGFALAFSAPTWLLGHQILPALAGGTSAFGGAIAIIMVYIARANPTGQQANISALRQISPQLEEAATSLGANSLTVLRKVTIPLVIPAIITSLTFAITKSITAITPIIFITTPQTKVMTSQILDEVDAGRLGNAFAYSTLLILLVLVLLIVTTSITKTLTRRIGFDSQIL